MKKFMIALAALCAASPLFADTEKVGDYTWSYNLVGDGATIYKGFRYPAVSPDPTDFVEIPDTLGGKPVTCIGEYACYYREKLTGVKIPDAVTSIGSCAFLYCKALKEVNIPVGVKEIGSDAFNGCLPLNGVTIPEGVTNIGSTAFYDCGLTEVRIPDSVTSIGKSAFRNCDRLSHVSLPWHFEGRLDSTVFEGCAYGIEIVYRPKPYTIIFHRADGSAEAVESRKFPYGESTALPKLNELSWARRGFNFKGWATSQVNAANGKVWKTDGAAVATAAASGGALEVWAVWELKSDCYAIQFIRNDGAGTWRIVGFPYGTKTRMPSLANGLGWARRGYAFNGWALTAANANNGVIWKGDWANIAEPTPAGTMLTIYASWSLKPGFYQIRFNKNDGTGKWRTLGFECGASAKLNTIAGLGWEREGHAFKGWASNKANADAGKVWKLDGAWVKDVTAEGKTLSIYALWE